MNPDYCNPTIPTCGPNKGKNIVWTESLEGSIGCGVPKLPSVVQGFCEQTVSKIGGGSVKGVCVGGKAYCIRPDQTYWPKANKFACCSGQKSGARDCAEEWHPSSESCRPTLGSYCSQDPLRLREEICRQFCLEPGNEDYCTNIAQEYCESIPENQRRRDDSGFCDCLWSNIKSAPCFDPKCRSASAFKTDAMKSINCKAQCDITIRDNGAGKNFIIDDNTFIQECGAGLRKWYACVNEQCVLTDNGQYNEGGCSGNCTPAQLEEGVKPLPINPTPESKTWIIFLVIAIVILIILILLIFFSLRSGKS